MKNEIRKLICLTLTAIAACPPAWSARFLDTSGNWAEAYINILSDKGIVLGEVDGKFRPDEPVTRAVLAFWLMKVMGLESQPVPAKPSFADVKADDWFYKPVEIIRQNNYISGYADGFRPNQFIQKAEVISIISRALNKAAPDEGQIEDELAKYKDGSRVPAWARVGVAEASLSGIMLVGPDTQSIGADKLASRGDTIALLYKLDEFLARRDESDALKRATASKPLTQAQFQEAAPQGGGWIPGNGAAQNYGGSNYQGQVAKGDYFGAQSPYSGAVTAPTEKTYAPQSPSYAAPSAPLNPQAPNPLQGGLVVLAAGTRFRAQLKNSIDTAATQAGEEIRCVINEAIYANGVEVIPAGSKLIGAASDVQAARRFHAGANGKLELKFTSCETPDGRTIPLSASVDESEQRLSGGSTAGRVGKGLLTTGVGAASGAALGTALGAIVGGTANGNVGKSTGMGAVFGTALGAGVGGVGALVRKGSELKLIAGSSLPIKLDAQMPVQLPQTAVPRYPGAVQPNQKSF
ncbi:MAG: S-layer homology domain-containing protein [Candidatus Obscuribacterales bacterium]|nr:S-layer homology domain-containing protein [Candidatus Obscuribacterales bacterium]